MKDEIFNLFSIAKNCDSFSNFSYELIVGTKKGKAKYNFVIDTKWFKERFTHISGLEHIDDISDFNLKEYNSTKKNHIRSATFNRIIQKEITFTTLREKSKKFYSEDKGFYKLDGPPNPNTNEGYTIVDRIIELNNIEKYFDNAYKGKVYEWKEDRTNIHADYVIAIERNLKSNNENFYIFIDLDQTDVRKNQKQKGTEPKKFYMRVVTAFPGNQSLVAGLRTVYTVLREDKVNLLSNECENRFIHNKYKQPTTVNAKTTTEYMKMDFRTISQSGEAVIDNIHQSTNGQAYLSFFRKIKQFFTEKIPQLFDNIRLQRELSKTREQLSKRDNQLFNALKENNENKLLLAKKDDLLSEKDRQLADSAKEIASLKEENSKLSEKIEALENQKQPVLTATKSKGRFGDNLPGFEDRIHSENAARSQQQGKPNLKPTDKPKL